MKNKKIHYFAYGSNLSHTQMRKRCPHSRFVGIAKIKNYRVTCTGYSSRWGGGGATIVKDPKRMVWGAVYELDDDCLLKLDGFEGVKYKFYMRKNMYCYFANGKKRLITTYIREPRKLHHASKRYRSTILKGAIYYGLPKEYIHTLAAEL